MADRDEVIKWLGKCGKEGICSRDCLYFNDKDAFNYGCRSNLMRDAYELLRIQDNLEYRHKTIVSLCDELYAMLKERKWNAITEDADGIIHGVPGDDGCYLMTDGRNIWMDDFLDGVSDGMFLDSGRDIREIKGWMNLPEIPEGWRK